MAHKYLNKIGVKSTEPCVFNTDGREKNKRQKRFDKERKIYGFDSRETWSMDYTLATWLYEHLSWYLHNAPINMEFHKIEVPLMPERDENGNWKESPEKTVTQKKAIKMVLKHLKYYIKNEDLWTDNGIVAEKHLDLALDITRRLIRLLWW